MVFFAFVFKGWYISIGSGSTSCLLWEKKSIDSLVWKPYMTSFGLSSMELVFCKLLIMACGCSNAFSHCFSKLRSGSKWRNAFFAV